MDRLLGHQLFEIEGSGEAGIAGAQKAYTRQRQDQRHSGINEFLADVAIESYELTELNSVWMSALNRDVGGPKAVGHGADRLHFIVSGQQRNPADLGMPDLPTCPAENAQAHGDQDETEARVIVAADRGASARKPSHSTALPPYRCSQRHASPRA